MKKILATILIVIMASAFPLTIKASPNISTSQTAGIALNQGLVGYWTFDGGDVTGGRAADKSGNGNSAIIANIATSTFYQPGQVGQAINLDGTDDYASTTSQIVLSGEFTVSFWEKNNNDAVVRMYLGTNTSGNTAKVGRGVTLNRFFVRVINAGSSDSTVTTPTADKWHHIVLTRNSSDKVDLIVDNGTVNRLFSDAAQTGNFVIGAIGRADGTSGQYANGSMDDVRVYNRALSSAERTQLYNQGLYRIATSPTAGIALNQNLIGYWTFDGRNLRNGVAVDSSGNRITGTLGNIATSTDYVPGFVGQALKFGVSEKHVNLTGLSPNTTANATNTLAFWMKWDGTMGSSGFGAIWGGTNYTFAVTTSGTCLGFNTLNSDCYGVSTSGLSGKWIHVVAEFCNGVPSACGSKIYINGVSQALTQRLGTGVSRTFNTAARIGNLSAFANNEYSGLIDDVRLYNRALTDAEARQLYNQSFSVISTSIPTGIEKGLSGYWTFDGIASSGGKFIDSSGNGNTATSTGISTSTFYRPGKIGQALNFDGVNDYLSLPNMSAFIGNEPVTISAWFNAESGAATIFSASDNDGFSDGSTDKYTVRIATTTNQLTAQTQRGSGAGSATYSTAIEYGKWYHVAAVFESDISRILYVNGVQVATNTGNEAIGTISIFRIGAANNSGTAMEFFKGLIDDVRAYNRALSAAEVNQLYNGN